MNAFAPLYNVESVKEDDADVGGNGIINCLYFILRSQL